MISLLLEGGGLDVEIQLNKKDNNEFRKIKKDTKTIVLKENSTVNLNIRRSRFPKRIKIILSDVKNGDILKISNINLKNKKWNIKDYSKFKVEGAEILSTNSNSINLKANCEQISLEYPETINISASIKFDIKALIIILILTYLISYKLSSYVADFNTIKGKPKTEVAFLTIFFIFLFVPMSRINQDEISIKENRTLAKLSPLINEYKEINYQFTKDFDNWFCDRFNLRNCFIGLYYKTTGFMYGTGELKEIKPQDIKENLEALKKLEEFSKRNNIKLYVLIVPQKTVIYKTDKTDRISNFSQKDFLQYLDEFKSKSHIKIIYPYEALLKGSKNNLVFFKTEHHWSDDGAYIGYLELMKEISKDFKDVKTLKENDFNFSYDNLIRGDFERKYAFGTTAEYLGVLNLKKYHKDKYRYFTHKDFENLKTVKKTKKFQRNKFFSYPKGANHRVIMLGTSQNENLSEFIPFTFKNVKRIRTNNVEGITREEDAKIMKYYKNEILDYHPDIMIFCITYGNIENLNQLFNME